MNKHKDVYENISSDEGATSNMWFLVSFASKPSSEPLLQKRKHTSFTISQEFIKTLSSAQQRKAFALYIKMKSVFNDTKFLNFSISRFHTAIGVSPHILRTYLPIMIQMGWAEYENKHLVLKSFKKVIPDKTRNLMSIPNNLSFQQTKEEIEFCNIREDYRQQMFMADMTNGRNKARRSIKSYKKLYDKYSGNSMGIDKTITSFRRIARLCGVSESTAHRKVGRWVDQGKMTISTNTCVVKQGYNKPHKPVMTEQGLLCKDKGNLILIQHSSFTVLK